MAVGPGRALRGNQFASAPSLTCSLPRTQRCAEQTGVACRRHPFAFFVVWPQGASARRLFKLDGNRPGNSPCSSQFPLAMPHKTASLSADSASVPCAGRETGTFAVAIYRSETLHAPRGYRINTSWILGLSFARRRSCQPHRACKNPGSASRSSPPP